MKIIYGVGINDSTYSTFKSCGWVCPFYRKWHDMIRRCYSGRNNCYKNTRVCDEWLTFSNFKSWMETQDWEGKQLDKDLLGDGSLYSPETCCFVPSAVNVFVTSKPKGKFPRGVKELKSGNFSAEVWDSNIGKKVYIGTFESSEKASEAYVKYKADLAKKYLSYLPESIFNGILKKIDYYSTNP